MLIQWNLSILWDLDFSPYIYRGVLNSEVTQYTTVHTGTQNGVLIIEVSAIQMFVSFHCTVSIHNFMCITEFVERI